MTVLVTGAFGLVGSATVRQLAAERIPVVATDLDIPDNRKAAAALPPNVQVRYADLTDPAAVDALLADVQPDAIVHLAALTPLGRPATTRSIAPSKPALRVTLASTATLVPCRITALGTDSTLMRSLVSVRP